MAAPHRPSPATLADLEALGADADAELIGGEIIERASPTMEHGRAQRAIGGVLGRRFDRRTGGRWPGGWWFATEVDVAYADDYYRHDVAGWRRDRVATCPSGRPVRIRPDWVCELLSPSNEKRDRIDKLRGLHAAAVPHYWIANPEEQTLVVHRWEPGGYLIVLTATADETIHAEPFEGVPLRVAALFGDDDED
jgi:Uma2 family endonuclease